MSRVVPYPVFSGLLFAMWLLLQQSVAPGHLVMGAIVALFAGLAMRALGPEPLRFRKPWLIPRFIGLVVYDIVRSNLAVFWIIVNKHRRATRSGFIHIRLDLENRAALAILAIILTATPGTIWLEYDPESRELLIHVLDLVDEATWTEIIKNRYERLLLEIFA